MKLWRFIALAALSVPLTAQKTDYTGSLVCEATLDRAAAVMLQERLHDREAQVFSFNLFDEHRPFTFRISLDALASGSVADLRRDLQEPGRRWAGPFSAA